MKDWHGLPGAMRKHSYTSALSEGCDYYQTYTLHSALLNATIDCYIDILSAVASTSYVKAAAIGAMHHDIWKYHHSNTKACAEHQKVSQVHHQRPKTATPR